MEISIKSIQQLGIQTAAFLAFLRDKHEQLGLSNAEAVEVQRKEFVDAFDYSHNSQIRYERNLEDAGLVEINRNNGSGRGNTYKLNASLIKKLYA